MATSGTPKLTCGKATILPHETERVACTLRPNGYRGYVHISCVEHDGCWPSKKSENIGVWNDESHPVELNVYVLASETRERYTLHIKVGEGGVRTTIMPLEIDVPQPPGSVDVICAPGQEIRSNGVTDLSCRIEPVGGFYGYIAMQEFTGYGGGSLRVPMTYIRVPRDGITVDLPVTAKNAPLGPKTLHFDMDPVHRFDDTNKPTADVVVVGA